MQRIPQMVYILPQLVYLVTIFQEWNSMRAGIAVNQKQDEANNGTTEYETRIYHITQEGAALGYAVEWLVGALTILVSTYLINPKSLYDAILWAICIGALFFIRNVVYSTARNLFVRPRIAKLSQHYLYRKDQEQEEKKG